MYPAIDLGSSVSRSMMNIADPQHQQHASFIKDLYSTYEENRDLISIGAYRQGSDPKIDIAISAADNIRSFIKQPVDEAVTFSESIDSLGVLVDGVHQAPGSDPNGLASQNNNRAQMRSE
jgi:flagellum-specific ATP synthase